MCQAYDVGSHPRDRGREPMGLPVSRGFPQTHSLFSFLRPFLCSQSPRSLPSEEEHILPDLLAVLGKDPRCQPRRGDPGGPREALA